MNARAVILDMDGLLLDTEPFYRHAWQEAVRRLGHELGEETFREENARFRDLGALLSQARDSQVLIQTALKLETLPGQVSNTALAAFKKMLQEDGIANAPVPDSVIGEAQDKLVKAAKVFRRLKVGVRDLSSGTPRILQWLVDRGHPYQHIVNERADLETVFLALTGRSLRD